jgi:hypothetical protein
MSRNNGFDALGPMQISVPTGWSSSRGRRASCAVTFVNPHDVRLFGHAVWIRVEPLVHVGRVRLRVHHLPVQDLVAIDVESVAMHLGGELLELLGVAVGADARLDAVVPAVQAADEVVAADLTVGEQRASVQAAPVQHSMLVAASDDDEVDPFARRGGWYAVGNFRPGCDLHPIHGSERTTRLGTPSRPSDVIASCQ